MDKLWILNFSLYFFFELCECFFVRSEWYFDVPGVLGQFFSHKYFSLRHFIFYYVIYKYYEPYRESGFLSERACKERVFNCHRQPNRQKLRASHQA